MAAHRSPKRKRLAAQPDQEITVPTQKAKVKDKKALTRAKSAETARPNLEEALAKAKKASRAAQAKVKHERQARIKAEEALTEAEEALAAAQLEVEQERQAQVRRVSFVVRLTVDEHGQLGRTEIEHVASRRKQNFLSLDGEHLVAFMKACVSPAIIPEHGIPTMPPSEKVESPTPRLLGPESSLVVSDVRAIDKEKEKAKNMEGPKSSLVVSDVRVFRAGIPYPTTLILESEKPFVVQARFQLQGSDASSLTAQELSYELKVYANSVTAGTPKLLTIHNANLAKEVMGYTTHIQVPGLSPGFYRLFTLATLNAPIKMAGFYDGPVIQVI